MKALRKLQRARDFTSGIPGLFASPQFSRHAALYRLSALYMMMVEIEIS